MSAEPVPTILAPGQWGHVLDSLIDAGLLMTMDPTLNVGELCRSRGLTDDEFEIVKRQRTSGMRMQKLVMFVRRRPSMASHLRAILASSHRPLLEVMEKALGSWYDVLCHDGGRLRAALGCLSQELDIVGEWAGPSLVSNGCLSEEEANKIANGQTSLSAILTGAEATSLHWHRFLHFLGEKQPDLLFFVDRACYAQGAGQKAATSGTIPQKSSTSTTLGSKATGSTATAEVKRLQATGTQRFTFWNDRTDSGPHLTVQSFDVAGGASFRDLREAVARRLGVASNTVILSCLFCRVDGEELTAMKDERGQDFFVAEGKEQRPESERQSSPDYWRTMEDEEKIPNFPDKIITLRASSSPLRPFYVVNQIDSFNEKKDFWAAFPVCEHGSAWKLPAAVARFMGLPSTDVVLSRGGGFHRGVAVGAVVDNSKRYFSDYQGRTRFEPKDVNWSWQTLKSVDVFLYIPDVENEICVSRRETGKAT